MDCLSICFGLGNKRHLQHRSALGLDRCNTSLSLSARRQRLSTQFPTSARHRPADRPLPPAGTGGMAAPPSAACPYAKEMASPQAAADRLQTLLVGFLAARQQDLQAAWGMLALALRRGSLPASSEMSRSVVWTTLAAVVAPYFVLVLATAKRRKLLFDSVESILAVALVLILLAMVLGLPIGASHVASYMLVHV